MERFKACEKEMKTKAYSKEGLTNSMRLDPREKEKVATGNFVSSMLEELDRQIEALEAEQETTQNSMKRGKKDTQKLDRLSELDNALERHRWHQDRLERILRMLENGTISPDIVNNIQDDIRYYIEENGEPDFAEDEEIYDELNLDEDEDAYDFDPKPDDLPGHSLEDLAVEHVKDKDGNLTAPSSSSSAVSQSHQPNPVSSTNSSSGNASKPTLTASSVPSSSGVSSQPASAAVATSVPPSSHRESSRKNTFSSTSSIPIIATSNPSAIGGMKPAPPPARSTNELKYASAAASGSSIPHGLSPLPPPSGQAPSQQSSSAVNSPTDTPAALAVPISPSSATIPTAVMSGAAAPVAPLSSSSSLATAAAVAQQQQPKNAWADKAADSPKAADETLHKQKPKSIQSPSTAASTPLATKSKLDLSSMKANGTVLPIASVEVPIPSTPNVNLPPGLQDLINSFDAAKKRIGAPPPISSISKLLHSSYLNAPDSFAESEPRYYQPQSPYPPSPYYPKEPLQIFSDPAIFAKMDVDTLFFIFYNRQGSYQQYLAAKELKNRSWRFHKHFMTWFQRHEEPKVINNDYEQGTYRYFDFEGLWSQRRKQNFTFEYKYLEDEL